jgi:hypothetical protein
MPPKRGRGFALSVLLLVAGFLSAPLAVGDTPSRVGLPLVIGLGVPVTFLIARAQREKEVGQFLLSVMLAAIGIRLLVLALIHSSVGPAVFAPDTEEYWVVGQELLDAWQGERPVPRKLVGSLQIGYYVLNAVAFLIFGRGAGAPVALNILLASWLAVPIYHLTRLCVRGHHGVARWATIMALFFPSLILWSVLNIREAPTIFAVALVVFFFVRFQVYPRARDLLFGAMAMLALLVLREYMMLLVGFSAGAGVVMGRSRSPIASFGAGAVLLVAATLVLQSAGVGTSLAEEPTLERVQYLRQDLGRDARSAFGQDADVSTATGAITYLPVGLTYFLLAPFPWSTTGALQRITLPESLVWYVLFFCALWGGRLAMRHDLRRYTVPLAVLITVTFAYALVEGNVGTAYRHRAQVLPLFFVLSAVGLRDLWGAWMEQRIRGRARQTAAGLRLRPPGVPRASP